MKKKYLVFLGFLFMGMVIFSNDLIVDATANKLIIGNEITTLNRRNENISTILNIKSSETVVNYGEQILDNKFGPSTNQSTGIYKRKTDTIEIYVDEAAALVPTYTLTGTSLTHYSEGSADGTPLKRGRNIISGTQEGIIHIQNETTQVNQPATRIEIRGGITIPRFILGKMTNQDWQTLVKSHPNAPGYELVGNRVLITGSNKTIQLVKEPIQILEAQEKVVELHDKTSGLDESSSLHRKPIGLIQHMRETSDPNYYMYAFYQHTAYHTNAMDKLLQPGKSSQWGMWHEIGHTYQVNNMNWRELTEVTVNIYSMRAQKALGQRSRLEEDGDYTRIFNYLNRAQGKNFDQQDVFIKLGMFWQLELAFGESFYPDLHKLYREEGKYLATEQEKRQYFILSASKISQTNLTPFFEKWGIEVTNTTSKQLETLPKLTKKIWEYRDEMKGDVGNITDDNENNEETTIEEWEPKKIYYGGEIVRYQGHKYLAKWWSFNKIPGTTIDWERLD